MKKILVIILALAVILSVLPLSASAADPAEIKLTIDGTEYTVHTGDTIHYKYYLDLSSAELGADAVAGKVTAVEGRVYYDKQQLKLLTGLKADDQGVYPALPNLKKGNVVCSDDRDTFFGFNAYIDAGYDFSNKKVLVQLDFEVIGDQASEINAAIRNLGSGKVRAITNWEVKIKLAFETSVKLECPHNPYPLGDVDLDHALTVFDATFIQRKLVGLEQFSDLQMQLADFDGSGDVTVFDATAIQRALVGLD